MNLVTDHSSRKIRFNKEHWLLIIGIMFIASTLRSPLTSVGPVIADIRESLQIPNILAGFLTTIPLLAFAIISPFVPRISRKFGMEITLFFSLCLLTVGIILRSSGTSAMLIVGTFLLGSAIAFGNVLLPGLIKLNFPLHIGLITGIYSVSMNLSASIAAGVSVPIAYDTKFGWAGSLGVWAILAIVATIIWLPQIKRRNKTNIPKTSKTAEKENLQLWRSPLAWAITFYMGLQSLIFYTTAAWLPDVLTTQGLSEHQAGWMLSVMQFSQMPMAFITPILASKLANQRGLVIFITVLFLLGYGGVFFAWTSLIILWVFLIGIAGGAAFGVAMMFFTLRTHTPNEAAEMSGMAQSFGYILAATGPVFFGFLNDVTGSWTLPLIVLFIAVIALFLAGMKAGKNAFVTQKA